MKAVIFICLLVLCVTEVFSVTISTPAVQKKSLGESCNIRWNVVGNFENYTIKFLSTASTTALGSNTNHAFNGSSGMITLFIWNIQTSNAGYYTLSIGTGPTEVTSIGVLFVYGRPYSYPIFADGRNLAFEGDKIELNCSVTSYSLPVEYQSKVYYYLWLNNWYGSLRNISSGAAVLINGDTLFGYSVKNDGKTLVIASAQYADSNFNCQVQEQGSPYTSYGYSNAQIKGRPYTYVYSPAIRRYNAVATSYISQYSYSFYYIYLNLYHQSNPSLTTYSNWSFVSIDGRTAEYSVESDPMINSYVSLSINSFNPYGNYSITLTNSYGSKTDTFQVLPPATPDPPSNFSLQYATHSIVSIQWRCRWFNGEIQTVFVRLIDAATKVEVETQTVPLATDCYNTLFSTLFKSNIQPDTNYEASIWSINAIGSSNVAKLNVGTPKIFVFNVLPANISIQEFQATIRFRIVNSTLAVVRLNVSCCVESSTLCSNKSYIIASTDNQIVYDILPTGTEYVFDFTVYDTDGYTYTSTLAIVKGVRLSRIDGERNGASCVEKENPLLVAVIVLAVVLGIAVLALMGCLVYIFVSKYRKNSSHQQTTTAHIPTPSRSNAQPRVGLKSQYPDEDDGNYESVAHVDPSNTNAGYATLESPAGRYA